MLIAYQTETDNVEFQKHIKSDEGQLGKRLPPTTRGNNGEDHAATEIAVRLTANGRTGPDEGGESARRASSCFHYSLRPQQTGHTTEVGQPHGVKDLTQPAPWHDRHTLLEALVDAVLFGLSRAASALTPCAVAVSACWPMRCGLATVGDIE